MSRIRSLLVLGAFCLAVSLLVAPCAAAAGTYQAFDPLGEVLLLPGLAPASDFPSQRPAPGVRAQATVPVTVVTYVQRDDGEDDVLEGRVLLSADATSNVENVMVTVTWYALDDTVVDEWMTWGWCHVLSPGDTAVFRYDRFAANIPAGAVRFAVTAEGEETTRPRIPLEVTYQGSGYGPGGLTDERWYVYSIRNTTTGTVIMPGPSGWEEQGTGAPPGAFLDILRGSGSAPWELEAGDSFLVFLRGPADATPGNAVWAYVQAEAVVEEPPPPVEPAVPVPVHRFYDLWKGRHAYAAEQWNIDDYVHARGYRFVHEGVAFWVYPGESIPDGPVYFVHSFMWKTDPGKVFYTVDSDEFMALETTYAHLWSYLGSPWMVPPEPDETTVTVYRFFNVRTGDHFYTADADERDRVIGTLGYVYYYEGAAFHALGDPGVGL